MLFFRRIFTRMDNGGFGTPAVCGKLMLFFYTGKG
ncbi:hypothetical protein EIO60_03312|nr:hypothetical protein [Candidatus Pantoea persica]